MDYCQACRRPLTYEEGNSLFCQQCRDEYGEIADTYGMDIDVVMDNDFPDEDD